MGGTMPPGFKKGDKIRYYIRIMDVYTSMPLAQAAYEKEIELQKGREIAQIEAYLKQKNIKANKTPLGVYVEMLNQGQLPLPDSGKTVSLKYTGYKFNGQIFDTNVDSSFKHTAPLELVIGQMGVVPGFEDGVKLLGKGGKAKLYIPSMLAYGVQGSGKIGSFENLIFEIEVLDIKLTPKTNPMPDFNVPVQGDSTKTSNSGGQK
jgi:FKBP-type peptidyl-prolyl cis-trans isomerase